MMFNANMAKSDANELFRRADKLWDEGNERLALRFFLDAAEAGDIGAQQNAGYFYDVGIGVRPNRRKALYWYGRAYRNGYATAATNIGTIWRDSNQPRRALAWFMRAVRMGDDDANLEIAKYHLRGRNPKKAIPFLERVRRSKKVSECSLEEASRLMKRARAI
jgi:TPR repeat protein